MLNLFRDTPLHALFEDASFVALDVGSRGGIEPDLLPMAWAVSAWGFEPDAAEFARLQSASSGPWRALSHLPEALAGSAGTRTLHVPSNPAGASLLQHDPAVGEAFAYKALFEVASTVEVETISLDEAVARHSVPQPSYLKLDIEGAELEVLEGSGGVLADVVAVKAEVAFIAQRVGQPLARDLQQHLEQRGFVLMDFMRPHRWRRYATAGAPYSARDGIRYSEGQLAQADYLFFRDPESIPVDDEASRAQHVRLALVALCYGYFDHAFAILDRDAVRSWAEARLADADARLAGGLDRAIEEASRRYGHAVSGRTIYDRLRDLIPLTRSWLRTLR